MLFADQERFNRIAPYLARLGLDGRTVLVCRLVHLFAASAILFTGDALRLSELCVVCDLPMRSERQVGCVTCLPVTRIIGLRLYRCAQVVLCP